MKKFIKKWEFKLVKIGMSIYASLMIALANINGVWADVSFNQSKAIADIKKIFDPVANFLIVAAIIVAPCMIGFSYFKYCGLEQEVKESKSFFKYIQIELFAIVGLGIGLVALKWFTISN